MKNKKEIFLILHNIRSLHNVGSIFRTADALAVDKIFLGGICGRPPHAKISKTALGAENNIDWEHQWQVWRIISQLKKEKVKIVALEQTKKSIPYNKFKPKFPLALVIGNEIKGVSDSTLKRADDIIDIAGDLSCNNLFPICEQKTACVCFSEV